MDNHNVNYLNLGWWNTGLSPMGKPRSQGHEMHLTITITLIIEMLINKSLDFLALGEVSRKDVETLSDELKMTKYEVDVCDEKVGNGAFCHAFVYNKVKLNVADKNIIDFGMVDRNYRVGQSLEMEESSGYRFLIVLSHWPSNLQNQNETVRSHLAIELKRYIEKVKNREGVIPHVILMGDYNSEPHEEPLSEFLLAIRDKTRVRKKGDLLYNPYWKKMGMSKCDRFCGSHYYKGGLLSNWFLFDQMMFSSPFITGDNWVLAEESVDIGFDPIYEVVTNSKTCFDHLPVFARLEKINE